MLLVAFCKEPFHLFNKLIPTSSKCIEVSPLLLLLQLYGKLYETSSSKHNQLIV